MLNNQLCFSRYEIDPDYLNNHNQDNHNQNQLYPNTKTD